MIAQVVGDESGSDGENLSRPTHRVFSYGTTNLDESTARDLVVATRREIGSTEDEALSGAELKLPRLIKKHRPIVEALFEAGGPLDGKASVYLADKEKFLAGKMVSLLIEEDSYASRRPIGVQYEAFYANEIADHVLPILGEAIRAKLLESFNRLCRSYKEAHAPKNRAQDFINALRLAILNASHDRRASSMLDLLWKARSEAYLIEKDFSQTLDLEPMLPTLLVVTTTWHERLRGSEFELLMDEYRQMTDQMLEIVQLNAEYLWGAQLKRIVQVESKDDPRVQIADWIAGAGRVVASEVVSGKRSRLSGLLLPFVDSGSMRSPESALDRWIAGI
ncbi:DUF3800 domain-containing protein [Curtobacterium sp. VKM Ac-2861]|uniref:DUF3800 domain-containing protein n=1 Tax=Curtobacterium sp. VKM Ac-2861 TaxID=2739016 RepID=UPI0015675EBF|nr:DUF3800 domain-containing protein [Curtobacterium sp. VKM Ac-2861]